jgi:hypothetical protein
MAAMAGALGVTLEKPGAYRLGDGRAPRTSDIASAIRIVALAAGLVTLAAIGGMAVLRTPWDRTWFDGGRSASQRSAHNAPSRQTFYSFAQSEVVMISAVAPRGWRRAL